LNAYRKIKLHFKGTGCLACSGKTISAIGCSENKPILQYFKRLAGYLKIA
jgi:hypothetical protein